MDFASDASEHLDFHCIAKTAPCGLFRRFAAQDFLGPLGMVLSPGCRFAVLREHFGTLTSHWLGFAASSIPTQLFRVSGMLRASMSAPWGSLSISLCVSFGILLHGHFQPVHPPSSTPQPTLQDRGTYHSPGPRLRPRSWPGMDVIRFHGIPSLGQARPQEEPTNTKNQLTQTTSGRGHHAGARERGGPANEGGDAMTPA